MVNDQMVNRTVPPFSMPMFRSWVPKRIQQWIYIAQVICIQFSCGVYLGAMEAVRGTTALQLDAYAGFNLYNSEPALSGPKNFAFLGLGVTWLIWHP